MTHAASLSIASSGSTVLKNKIMTSTAAPTINDKEDKNMEKLASCLIVFAPATVKTVPVKLAIMPAINIHISVTEGEVSDENLIEGTNSRRQPKSIMTKLATERVNPKISTVLRACMLEYGASF